MFDSQRTEFCSSVHRAAESIGHARRRGINSFMGHPFFYLYSLACSPFLAFLVHMLIARVFRSLNLKMPPLVVAAIAVLVGYVLMGVWVWWNYIGPLQAPRERIFASLYGSLVYSGLSFCYFMLFNMTEAARRIRIMRELYFKNGLSLGELYEEYNVTKIVGVRLNRLIGLKQLRKEEGRYFLKGRFLYYSACVIFFWAKLIGFSYEKNFRNGR